MSAEDILDKWFDGPKNTKKENPRELLKSFQPVSYQGRVDFVIGLELGRLRGTKFELKYHAWGFYRPRELEELLTMTRLYFIKQSSLIYEREHTKTDIAAALNIPETEKEASRSLSKGMAYFFKGPLT
ncbi:MAG: hypothetical protein H0X33_13225 [Taibaiella sp.]|nr:hypothetical protein [Taibaiella sp.]